MKLTVTVWDEKGEDIELIAEVESYDYNLEEGQIYFVGDLKSNDPNKTSKMEGRTVNVYMNMNQLISK